MLLLARYLMIVLQLAAFCENQELFFFFLPKNVCYNLPKDRGDNKWGELSPLWKDTERVMPDLQKHEYKVHECVCCTITLFVQSVAVIG